MRSSPRILEQALRARQNRAQNILGQVSQPLLPVLSLQYLSQQPLIRPTFPGREAERPVPDDHESGPADGEVTNLGIYRAAVFPVPANLAEHSLRRGQGLGIALGFTFLQRRLFMCFRCLVRSICRSSAIISRILYGLSSINWS